MEKSEFYDLVGKLIVPLFTGSHLAGEEESSSRDLEVALGKGNTILLKPTKMDTYRLVIKRGQAFKSFEVNLIKSIIREINEISNMNVSNKTYLDQLYDTAIEKSLVASITTEVGGQTILGIINALKTWSVRTYEGAVVKLGVLVNLGASTEQSNPVFYNKLLTTEFFSRFTDGVNSFVEFDKTGNLMGYVNLGKVKSVPTIAPYSYEKLARICTEKRVGIVLTDRSDVLVFFAHQLVFARRNGNWCVYSHDEIIRLLQSNVSYTAKQIRRSIYNTALDCSYAYKGACLVYLDKDKTMNALNHIDASDIISEEHFNMKKQLELEEATKLYNIGNAKEIIEKFSLSFDEFLMRNKSNKSVAIKKIIAGKKLFELDRKLILEMTSVDGATIIDYDGTIIAVGAIIKIEAGSLGGGRLAAATTMSKYGVAIKVSQDGIMQGFGVDKQGKTKMLFNVG